MSTFLEDTLDHVSQLPNEVRRALDLLHSIDARWHAAMQRWRAVQEQLLTRARARVASLPRDGSVDLRAAALPPGDALVVQCAELQALCSQLAEHKCAAADAAEELVRLHCELIHTLTIKVEDMSMLAHFSALLVLQGVEVENSK